MSKTFVDGMIRNMKMANIVTKATPWLVEGMGDKTMNVRYVGITLKDDWTDIFPPPNNFLIKFIIDRSSARIEYYLANKPPFFRIQSVRFTDSDKWEVLLGELKRRLKKDKVEFQNHMDKVGNLYAMIKPELK